MTKNTSEWDAYSTVYDLFYGSYDDDIAYLKAVWSETWRSVLEVGVGTGRLIKLFREQGVVRYLGIDTSPEMLAIGAAGEMPPGYELRLGDIHHHAHHGAFDLILYPFNTANYLIEPADLVSDLRVCRDILNPGGVVVLDLCLPFFLTRPNGGNGSLELRCQAVSNGVTHELHDRRVYVESTQIESREHRSIIKDRGAQDSRTFRTCRRYYSPAEMQDCATAAGLLATAYEAYGTPYFEGYYVQLTMPTPEHQVSRRVARG